MLACKQCKRSFARRVGERTPFCSADCRDSARKDYQRRYYAEKKSNGAWGISQAATRERTNTRQTKHACDACFEVFFRYGNRKGRKKHFCSVECRQRWVADQQIARRGVPRIERPDPQQCTKCREWRPLTQFYPNSSGLPQRKCSDCCQRVSSESKRRSHLRGKFGISLEDWFAIYDSQGGCCAICTKRLPDKSLMVAVQQRRSSWKARDWNTDHCHKTNRVRGILCRACNTALGALRDNPETARRAAEYIELHRSLSLAV